MDRMELEGGRGGGARAEGAGCLGVCKTRCGGSAATTVQLCGMDDAEWA